MTNNYVEYILINTNIAIDEGNISNEPVSVLDTNIPEAVFSRLMKAIMQKHCKYYERKIKQYIHENTVYEVVFGKDPAPEIRAYVNSVDDVEYIKELGMLKLGSHKRKIPIHAFPSSSDIQDISYIRRVTFRKNNRIYINFDCTRGHNGTIFRKVFANVNMDANIDHNYIMMELAPVLQDIKMAWGQARLETTY
jgi:hypothetical protein